MWPKWVPPPAARIPRALADRCIQGMVVGRAPGGGDLIVGTGDGGVIPADAMPPSSEATVKNDRLPGMNAPSVGEMGYGNSASYGSGIGEPLSAAQQPQGPNTYDPYGKR